MSNLGRRSKSEMTLPIAGNFHGNAEVFCELPHKSKKHHAKKFCETCDRNLCKHCYKTHKKGRQTKRHRFWVIPKTREILEDVIYEMEKCEIHKTEEIKYYCQQCKKTVCEICSLTLHQDHGKRDYIPDVAKGFDETKEFEGHYDKIRMLQLDLDLDKSQYEKHSKIVNNLSTDALNAIKKQRDEMNKFYDQLENQVRKEVQTRKEENVRKLKTLETENTALAEELKEFKAELNNHEGNEDLSQLFIAVKKSNNRLQEIEAEVNKIKTENKVVWYVYERNPLIVDLTRNVTKFGQTVETTGKQAKVLSSYDAQNKGELNLTEGEIINIIDMPEDNLWKGELDNKIGVFPKSHVELLTEDGYLEPWSSSFHRYLSIQYIPPHDDELSDEYEEMNLKQKSSF